jgi:hypothetical protein
MKLITYTALALLLFTACNIQQKERDMTLSLREGFRNPPTEAKPKGYWSLVNGNFDLFQMTRELKEFKDKGMGTLDIWDVSGWVDPDSVEPAGPPFMGEQSVQAIAHAIREAGKLGLDAGLVISSSWNAGGSWVQPEDGVMGLFDTTVTLKGNTHFKGALPFPHIPDTFGRIKMLLKKRADGLPTFYKDVAVLAYKSGADSTITEALDISSYFNGEKLDWQAPAGKWRVTRYVVTGTGQPLMRPSPNSNGLMIDHFNADAMRKHLNYFFEKLQNELGDLSKSALKYLYTDSYEANSAVWTVKLPEEFEKRRGYSLIPYLPAMQGYVVKDKETTERFLFDLKKTLSDLIIENHYKLGKKLCNEKGLDFIAEAGGPGPPIHNCPFESLSSLGACDVPRGEFWYEPSWDKQKIEQLQIIKGPASAAHLYNRPRVEAEAFTGLQLWQFGPGDIKQAADKAMCEGLNSFVYHTTPHIPREAGIPGWVYNFGTIINTTRAWWPLSDSFHHYLGRSSFLLQQGDFVGDVLFYYGDKAPNFVKHKSYIPQLGFGYDYDYVNSDIILNKLDVKKGRFVLPHGQSYRVLVLPDEERMNPAVLEKIMILLKKGAIVVGRKPLKSYSLNNFKANDERVQELAAKLWHSNESRIEYGEGILYTSLDDIRSVLKEQNILPDVQLAIENPQNYLDYIHRVTDKADIYFIRNVSAERRTFQLTLRSVRGAPELWNPDNGDMQLIPVYVQNDRTTTLPVTLDGYGSAFIIFNGAKNREHIVNIRSQEGPLFPAETNELPFNYVKGKICFIKNGNYTLTAADNSQKNVKLQINKSAVIDGPWQVRFPYGWGAPQRVVFDKLISWTEAKDRGIKYFSGMASYHKTFELPENPLMPDERLILDLGEVSKAAKVYLNGRPLRTLWHAPYRIDITEAVKTGKNYLVVEVANVFSNQMTGDSYRKGRDKRTHSNITKGPNAWHTPWRDVPLVKSGLLGPVKIEYGRIY